MAMGHNWIGWVPLVPVKNVSGSGNGNGMKMLRAALGNKQVVPSIPAVEMGGLRRCRTAQGTVPNIMTLAYGAKVFYIKLLSPNTPLLFSFRVGDFASGDHITPAVVIEEHRCVNTRNHRAACGVVTRGQRGPWR